jgi:hypothetical protein
MIPARGGAVVAARGGQRLPAALATRSSAARAAYSVPGGGWLEK